MLNNERELTGGNMSSVTTDGSIVYKDAKPQSTTIHRLLKHLESYNIRHITAPKALGFDNAGREMLSYVPGNTIEDYPPTDNISDRINIVRHTALMLHDFHDATVSFVRTPEDIWFLKYDGDLPKEVICHNDFAPYNITFCDNLPIGLIDFDTACPAPREWDIAYAVYRFVPLSQQVYCNKSGTYRDYDHDKDMAERKILLKEFLNVYGFGMDIKKFVIKRLTALVNLFDEECEKNNPAFIKMKAEGHQDFYIKEIDFISENFKDWM